MQGVARHAIAVSVMLTLQLFNRLLYAVKSNMYEGLQYAQILAVISSMKMLFKQTTILFNSGVAIWIEPEPGVRRAWILQPNAWSRLYLSSPPRYTITEPKNYF